MSLATRETKIKTYLNLISTLCEICDYFHIDIRLPDGTYNYDKIYSILNELTKFSTIDVNERVNNLLIGNIEKCNFIDELNDMINDKIIERCPVDHCGKKNIKENCNKKCRLCKCCSQECFSFYSSRHCYCCAELLEIPGNSDMELCTDCKSKLYNKSE